MKFLVLNFKGCSEKGSYYININSINYIKIVDLDIRIKKSDEIIIECNFYWIHGVLDFVPENPSILSEEFFNFLNNDNPTFSLDVTGVVLKK